MIGMLLDVFLLDEGLIINFDYEKEIRYDTE
jgi:hypothetical protein